MKVRRFNSSGIEQFKEWLDTPLGSPPKHLLEDERYCDELSFDCHIDATRTFPNSFSLGKYLHEEVFKDLHDSAKLHSDSDMWAWVSLAMISNLLSKSKKKLGKPLDKPHYIDAGKRLGYRLIVRTAWNLVRIHGDQAIVALGSAKSPWGEMAEQLTSRQEVFSHPNFWAVARRLYLHPKGELRRGSTSQRSRKARRDPKNTSGLGGARRLPLTFRQFDRTYNTREMKLEEMLQLLPHEYQRWIVDEKK